MLKSMMLVVIVMSMIGCSSASDPRQLLLDGPAEYDISALNAEQQALALDVFADLNRAVGFEAFTADVDDGLEPYGHITIAGDGCFVPDGKAGQAFWNATRYRASICLKWNASRVRNMLNLTHELMHTVGIGHDDDIASVMHTPPANDARGMPHHIAHIKAMAGLD